MMEIPIQVAIRIKPIFNVNDLVCVHPIPYNHTIQVGNQHSFPVNYALPQDCSQSYIFLTTVCPLINSLLEGCDVSIVTLGQTESGKTYTILGPGLHCAHSESEHGIIPRFIREIFSRVSSFHDRNVTITMTWTQICGENLQDILGEGSVHVTNVAEAFDWLQIGISNMAPANAHTLFTLTIEQQYVVESVVEHKISTASFTDLASCEKVVILDNFGEPRSLPIDNGLLTLHNVIQTLTDTNVSFQQNYVPYDQSMLTTLLKDSFGGRAKTLVIGCLSPLLRDFTETIYTLQLALKIQCIRNFVTLNSYTNNTLDNLDIDHQQSQHQQLLQTQQKFCDNPFDSLTARSFDMFGLHFAISQWTKLVMNAENLFNKLISTKQLTDSEIDQISKWLLLKAECEECLSSEETISIDNLHEPQRSLGRIEEENELDNETSNLTETDSNSNGFNESESNEEFESEECSDFDSQKPDFTDKLDSLMQTFRLDTDHLILESYEQELKSFNSNRSNSHCQIKSSNSSRTGRRHSIHPINAANNNLIPDLIAVAAITDDNHSVLDDFDKIHDSIQQKLNLKDILSQSTVADEDGGPSNGKELVKLATDPVNLLKTLTTATELKEKKIRQIAADLESCQKQINELEYTIEIKESLITSMIKNCDTRTYAKQKFQMKRKKLQQEYYKVRTQLAQAENSLLHCHNFSKLTIKDDIEKYRNMALFYEKRLKDLESIRIITEDSARKVLELQNSLNASRKQLEKLKKLQRKDDKQKQTLEQEVIKDRAKIVQLESHKVHQDQETAVKPCSTVKLKSVSSLSSPAPLMIDDCEADDESLDAEHVKIDANNKVIKLYRHLLNKTSLTNDDLTTINREICPDKDSLRHEIRKLRRTRDYLLEQRCQIDTKLKKEKMLSETEERKLLEFEEYISAIDCMIEYKNELICGRKLQIITNGDGKGTTTTSSHKETFKDGVNLVGGEELLMQRLLKLSEDEMRTLLCKYFNRVIDLRESSKKLELQNVQLERECESNIWRIQTLSHLLQQIRLESERRVVVLQQQHEEKLNLLMRHFCDETSTSASSDRSDADATTSSRMNKIMQKIFAHGDNRAAANQSGHASNQLCCLDPSVAAAAAGTSTSYNDGSTSDLHHQHQEHSLRQFKGRRVVAKYTEESSREKNNLIAKFQELTRYHSEKRRVNNAAASMIPSQNLRQLQSTSDTPSTKVTRQKNKLIIQQSKTKK